MKDWIEHFREASKGLVVAHIWRGYGSALLIEFGDLTPAVGIRRDGSPRAPAGEIALMIELDWRIEEANVIACGSSSDDALKESTFARLIGTRIIDVAPFGRLPELRISISESFHVVSFATLEGDPAWTLFDRRKSETLAVGCQAGSVVCVT